MVGCVESTYKVKDLDRALKRELLDLIDYKYRFRDDDTTSVTDVIEELIDEIKNKVADFYAGIDGIEFDLNVEDIYEMYKATMM